jgi:hypothetical protein
MKHRLVLLIGLLTLEHCGFVAIAARTNPASDGVVLVIFAWFIVTALTAAIACCPYRSGGLAAPISGAITGGLFSYLAQTHGYLHDDQDEHARLYFTARLIGGVVLALITGGFVHVVAASLRPASGRARKERVALAAWKGFSFAFLCVALTIPVLLLLLPGRDHPLKLQLVIAYAVTGIAFGSLAGALVGVTYTPRVVQSKPPGEGAE